MKNRRLTWVAALLSLGLVLSGCSGGSLGSGSPAPPPPAPAVTAAVTACDNDSCTSGSTFNIYQVKILRLTVNWNNLPAGPHLQTILVRMPDGAIYKRYTASIHSSTAGTASWSGIFNIRGTNIWAQALTGNWKVEAVLGDDAEPVSTTQLNLTD